MSYHKKYVKTFLALSFAIGDFELTSLYQTLRKAFVTILLGAVGPLYIVGGPVSSIFVLILGVSGLRLAFNNLYFIPTSPVDVTKGLKPRIPGIPNAIDLVLPDLRYEDTVNMQDVTGLGRQEFTDRFDLGQTEPNICKHRQEKEVNFLDKFGDSEQISESEKWNTVDNEFMVPEKRNI